MEPVTIVGAGLVGSLFSVYLARRGYQVTVFERNADPRTAPVQTGTSINLTLCTRGLGALDSVGVGQAVRRLGTPVRGRLIHMTGLPVQWQPYGNHGEALLSVRRNELNGVLLDHAQSHFPITFHFGHKCTGVDLSSLDLTFEGAATGRVVRHRARWLIAADGAFSAVRLQMQQRYGFNYSQEYSALAYKQLDVPASADGWTAQGNALHIWPRGSSMLLAIPNRDGSFTATLMVPLRGDLSHESITTAPQIEQLFKASFPDAVAKIPALVDNFLSRRPIPLVTIRCSPWSVGDRVLLVGDAAHAIYPSYGQGANAGFEDCAVFDACLDRSSDGLSGAIAAFEELRRPHSEAIADLSKQHLLDLCAALGSPDRTLRDRIERKLNQMYPEAYIPLYCMVSFTDIPYAEALQIDRDRRSVVDALSRMPEVRGDLDDARTERLIAGFVQRAGLLTTPKEMAR